MGAGENRVCLRAAQHIIIMDDVYSLYPLAYTVALHDFPCPLQTGWQFEFIDASDTWLKAPSSGY